jgi:GT2 family glycosyltransferase/glycosyltransferase involved in cell wall biosynthesis
VSTPTASVILHGHVWPEAAWDRQLRDVLPAASRAAGLAGIAEVLEARENSTSAVGAAAAINEAAETAAGELLIVIEAGCAWDGEVLQTLASAVRDADVLAVAAPGRAAAPSGSADAGMQTWNDAWIPTALPTGPELTVLVEAASRVTLEEWAAQLHHARPRMWAIRRATLRALGGLDRDFWSVGLVEDLAGRARTAGVPVRVTRDPRPAGLHGDAWPLLPHIRQLLAVRNALVSAAGAPTARQAGRAFAVVATLALSEAWTRAAIDPERLRFGTAWGSAAGHKRPRPPAATGPEAALWPAQEAAALLPILALDSGLDGLAVEGSRRPAGRWPVPTQASTAAPAGAKPAVPGSAGTSVPFVSVIVVNWNGRKHLEACFSSLAASDYPSDRLELICVDNGSEDGSRELLEARFPKVQVVALPENRGFTGGNAAGVERAAGEVLVFLNNDMRVDPAAIRRLVSAIDDEHPCAAAEVRSWNGRRIDFVRGSVNFEAHGFQDHYGEPRTPDRAAADETFFPNGGAFAITREAYRRAGGFDADYFAYYEDVDLGYAIRLTGGRIRMAHDATVYHRHGATSRRHPVGQKRFLMERNAIWTVLKRYEGASLDRALGAVLLLSARRIAQETVLRRRHPWARALAPFASRCRRRAAVVPRTAASVVYAPAADAGAGPPPGAEIPLVESLPIESLAAVGEALRDLPRVLRKRRESQARRVAPDAVVLSACGRPLAYGSPLSSYQAAHDALVETLNLAEIFQSRPRLLIVTHEPLRRRLSGPGIRVLELGRALSGSARVTIAAPGEIEITDDRCTIASYDPDRAGTMRRLGEAADVLLVQGFTLTQFPFLASLHVPIVVDLYCPFTVEFLELKAAEARARGAAVPGVDAQLEAVGVLEVQNAQLELGDFFLCASERQRDFWLGALHTAGRLNTRTYAADSTLRALIDVVPFGVPTEDFAEAAASAHARLGPRVLKGARPGIGTGDHVLFWGGSLLDWQDPLTLIQAVARLDAVRPDVKLFFAGTRHPNPQVSPMQVVEASRALARDLGLLDRAVFFNDWIPYEDRAAYLHEADLGLSTHRLHLETHLSFRTRMLDYIWAGLPIVCTEGDHFAELVRGRGLGLVVPPGDAEALAAAIAHLLDRPEARAACRAAARSVAAGLRWREVAEPLRRFVAAPRVAADREPAIRAIRAKLRDGYRVSKGIKRLALRLGVSEGGFERIKSLPPVRLAMRVRNRVALARAGRLRG